MMKNLLAGAAFCALSTGAFAADLSARSFGAAPLSVFSWRGAYVGGSLGFAQSNVSHGDYKTGDSSTAWFNSNGASYDTSGKSAAAFVNLGYNYQMGGIVVGLEGDFGRLNAKGANLPYGNAELPADYYLKASINALASVRGRLGYSIGSTLLYATGGMAYGNMKYSTHYADYADLSKRSWKSGWAMGGGLEYALDKKWILRTEGMYYDFGSKTEFQPSDDRYYLVTKATVTTARAGVNYRF